MKPANLENDQSSHRKNLMCAGRLENSTGINTHERIFLFEKEGYYFGEFGTMSNAYCIAAMIEQRTGGGNAGRTTTCFIGNRSNSDITTACPAASSCSPPRGSSLSMPVTSETFYLFSLVLSLSSSVSGETFLIRVFELLL